jgi:hypothetical protein
MWCLSIAAILCIAEWVQFTVDGTCQSHLDFEVPELAGDSRFENSWDVLVRAASAV